MPPISVWVFSPQSDPSAATLYQRKFTSPTRLKKPKAPVFTETALEMPDYLRNDVHTTLKR